MKLLKTLIEDIKILKEEIENLKARIITIETQKRKLIDESKVSKIEVASPYINKMFKLVKSGYFTLGGSEVLYVNIPTEGKIKSFIIYRHTAASGGLFPTERYWMVDAIYDIIGDYYKIDIYAGTPGYIRHGYYKLYEINFDFGTLV